jgi:hypothetical protein
VRWDPDTENRDIYGRDDNKSSPLQLLYRAAVLSNKGDSIDDDLH